MFIESVMFSCIFLSWRPHPQEKNIRQNGAITDKKNSIQKELIYLTIEDEKP